MTFSGFCTESFFSLIFVLYLVVTPQTQPLIFLCSWGLTPDLLPIYFALQSVVCVFHKHLSNGIFSDTNVSFVSAGCHRYPFFLIQFTKASTISHTFPFVSLQLQHDLFHWMEMKPRSKWIGCRENLSPLYLERLLLPFTSAMRVLVYCLIYFSWLSVHIGHY